MRRRAAALGSTKSVCARLARKAEQKLQHPWEQYVSSPTGKFYWYNPDTQEISPSADRLAADLDTSASAVPSSIDDDAFSANPLSMTFYSVEVSQGGKRFQNFW